MEKFIRSLLDPQNISVAWTVVYGVSTLFIASMVAGIAIRNAVTAEHKLRFDLYEKRFEVFRGINTFLWHVRRHKAVTQDELSEYRENVQTADFLFDRAVPQFMQEVLDEANELDTAMLELSDFDRGRDGSNEERQEILDRKNAALKALNQHGLAMKEVFMPYLDFRKLRLEKPKKSVA